MYPEICRHVETKRVQHTSTRTESHHGVLSPPYVYVSDETYHAYSDLPDELRDELLRTVFVPHLLALVDSKKEVVQTECVKTFTALVEHGSISFSVLYIA